MSRTLINSYPIINEAPVDLIEGYRNAHSNLSQAQNDILNSFANALDAAGIWSDMIAIYPLVGNNIDDLKLDLVNADPTFFQLTINPSTIGVNKLSVFGATRSFNYSNILRGTHYDYDDVTFFSSHYYMQGSNFWMFNTNDTGAVPTVPLRFWMSSNIPRYQGTTPRLDGPAGTSTGIQIGTRSGTAANLYWNGVNVGSNTQTSATGQTNNSLGARIRDGEMYVLGLASRAFNSTEVSALNNAISNLDAAIGR